MKPRRWLPWWFSVAATPLLVVVVAACGKSAKPSKHEPQPIDVATAAPTPPARKLVDLLHFTPAVVAVSSKVDNPKDFPEHLVDGKPETAWNGKTGDLNGGWMAFRVPRDAHVSRIELTAGFDKTSGDKDLFAMNVRITRVRVLRDGVQVTEATLDPERRDLQSIPLDQPGGDFRIEVQGFMPGTRADYRELCVSELAVIGLPGRELTDHLVLPRVYVGSLEGNVLPPPRKAPPPPSGPLGPGPFPSPEAFCAAHDKAVAPELFRKWGSGDRYPGEVLPECKLEALPVKVKLAPPFLAALGYVATLPEERVAGVLVRTERGWFPTTWKRWTHAYDDPGCMHSGELKLLELGSPNPDVPLVWMRMLTADSYWMQMKTPAPGTPPEQWELESWTTWSETLHVCRMDAEGALACDEPRVLATARLGQGTPDSPRWKPPFKDRKTAVVGEAGVVELLP